MATAFPTTGVALAAWTSDMGTPVGNEQETVAPHDQQAAAGPSPSPGHTVPLPLDIDEDALAELVHRSRCAWGYSCEQIYGMLGADCHWWPVSSTSRLEHDSVRTGTFNGGLE
jgi:hypothetical protein